MGLKGWVCLIEVVGFSGIYRVLRSLFCSILNKWEGFRAWGVAKWSGRGLGEWEELGRMGGA